MKYQEFGYANLDQYKEDFYKKLMPSNNTKEYFVDWQKVNAQVNGLLSEIYLLNSLIKIEPERREAKLWEILTQYPKTRAVIPLILVVKDQVSVMTIKDTDFEYYDVDLSKGEPKKIVKFCKETGIMDLFGQIKDLHDYLVGVGVGRDSNARKNRSGKIFQKIIKNLLDQNKVSYVPEDPNFEFEDPVTKRKKRPDFVIYKNGKPIVVVEANFYNVTGSKPIEIVESYVKLHQDLKRQGMKFLWITDGPAWLKMKNGLNVGFNDIDYIMNYSLLKEHLPDLLKGC